MIAAVDEIEIGYDDVGNGTPVVFIHGFPHNRTLWAPQLSALAGQCRCIALDLRGFGESSAVGPWTVSRHADDVAGLLDQLKIPSAVIVGLSMGGYIAFEMVRRHRGRVRALVLADTKQGADNAEAKSKRLAMMEVAKSGGAGAIADAQLTGMVGKSTRERNPQVADELHRMMASASVPGILGALHALMERPDSTDTAADIDVPTMIIVGAEDVLTPPKEAKAMAKAIRGSTIDVIDQAGHVSNFERPAAFNHLLTEFLARIDNE